MKKIMTSLALVCFSLVSINAQKATVQKLWATDTILKAFDAKLKGSKYIKDYVFVSKEDAAKNNKDIVGEDFLEFLGMNPLPNSFDIHFKGEYVESAKIKEIESDTVETSSHSILLLLTTSFQFAASRLRVNQILPGPPHVQI